MLDWIKKFFSGIGFGDLLNGIGSIIGNVINTKNVEKTNATNMQIAQEANAAQSAESEKAYERSKAGNQVNLMMQAGMSRAGAINALNGGGSYTPAPVNTAQAEAPQVDTSFLQSIASNALQAKVAEDSLRQQHEQFKAELDLKERQFNEEALNNKVMRDLNEAQIKLAAKQLDLTEQQIKHLAAQTDLTMAQVQTECAKYDMTVAQVVQIQEQTKLTTAQVLQLKAATKLTEQQVLTELEKTGLVHEQAVTAAKQYQQVAMEVDEFLRMDSQVQRSMTKKLNLDILSLARDLQLDEKAIKHIERLDAMEQHEITTTDGNPVAAVLRCWSFMCDNALPLKGLLSYTHVK